VQSRESCFKISWYFGVNIEEVSRKDAKYLAQLRYSLLEILFFLKIPDPHKDEIHIA